MDKKKEVKEFNHESLEDRESILNYLTSLTDGIRNGTIEFGNKKECISLNPPNLVNLKIKARRKKGKSGLELKISWKSKGEKKEKSHQEDAPFVESNDEIKES